MSHFHINGKYIYENLHPHLRTPKGRNINIFSVNENMLVYVIFYKDIEIFCFIKKSYQLKVLIKFSTLMDIFTSYYQNSIFI